MYSGCLDQREVCCNCAFIVSEREREREREKERERPIKGGLGARGKQVVEGMA
jgi:hypothetical protein